MMKIPFWRSRKKNTPATPSGSAQTEKKGDDEQATTASAQAEKKGGDEQATNDEEKSEIDSHEPLKSGVLYLKGDEVALVPCLNNKKPDFYLATATHIFAKNPGTTIIYINGLRSAAILWQPDEFTKETAVKKIAAANEKTARAAYLERQNGNAAAFMKALQESWKYPRIWHPGEENVDQVFDSLSKKNFLQYKKVHRELLDGFGARMLRLQDKINKGDKTTLDYKHAPDDKIHIIGNTISDKRYKEIVRHLESDPNVFPDEYKTLFEHHFWPIVIRDKLIINHNDGRNDQTVYCNDASHGTWVNAQFVEKKSFSTKDQLIDHYRFLSKLFTEAVFLVSPLTLEEMGISDENDWRAVSIEFNKNAAQFMTQLQRKADAAIPADYRPADVVAHMRYLLNFEHIHGYSEEDVRGALPASSAMYDRFMQVINERAAQIKSKDASKNDSKKRQQDKTKTGRVTPTPPPIKGWLFDPTPFTDEPLEQNLINAAKPFVADMLKADPPYNQCHVRLSPRGGRSDVGHPIEITMRNRDRETQKFTVWTGTDDLVLSQALKMHLQSHLLSYPEIEPLWMSRLHKVDKPHVLSPDEIIPNIEPTGYRLVNHFSFYAAEFTFTEDDGLSAGTYTLRIPLGIDFNPNDQPTAKEAHERMMLVNQHLADLRGQSPQRWETVSEAARRLKNIVYDEKAPRPFGWRVGMSMPVEGYGGKDKNGNQIRIPLDFPAPGSGTYMQTTTLVGARLQLEKGPKYPNPRWRLHMAIKIDGLGPRGDESLTLQPTINLHTENELAAQERAVTAIESLRYNLELLATDPRYDGMHWRAIDDKGTLIIASDDGRQPENPDPRNFAELMEDTAQFQANFEVVEQMSERRKEHGRICITLGVNRGIEADGDLAEFMIPGKAVEPRPMRLQFYVSQNEEAKIPEIIESLNVSFKGYLNEAFDNRTTDVNGRTIRKHRDHYDPRTIQNLFFEVFASEMKHGTVSDSMTPMFARYKGHDYGEAELTSAVVDGAANKHNRRIRHTGEKYAPMFDDRDIAEGKASGSSRPLAENTGLKNPSVREAMPSCFAHRIDPKKAAPKKREIIPGSDDLARTGMSRKQT